MVYFRCIKQSFRDNPVNNQQNSEEAFTSPTKPEVKFGISRFLICFLTAPRKRHKQTEQEHYKTLINTIMQRTASFRSEHAFPRMFCWILRDPGPDTHLYIRAFWLQKTVKDVKTKSVVNYLLPLINTHTNINTHTQKQKH